MSTDQYNLMRLAVMLVNSWEGGEMPQEIVAGIL